MTGIVVRQKNSTRVILTLDLIMKSISVDVDGQDLEGVGHDPVSCGYIPSLASSYESVTRKEGA